MTRALLILFLCTLSLGPVSLGQGPISPLPSTSQAGTGSPIGIFACDSTVVTSTTATIYIQRNALPGQALWTCSLNMDNTYSWVQRPAAIASATGSTLMAAGAFSLAGCASTIYSMPLPGAVVGSNGIFMTPIYTTAPTATNPGFLYLPGWVSAANTASFQICSLGILPNYPSFYPRAFLY